MTLEINMQDNDELIKAETIPAFCKRMNIKKVELANLFRVKKQQLNNWETSDTAYRIQFNKETGVIRLIRPRKILKTVTIPDDMIRTRAQKPKVEAVSSASDGDAVNIVSENLSWKQKKEMGLI